MRLLAIKIESTCVMLAIVAFIFVPTNIDEEVFSCNDMKHDIVSLMMRDIKKLWHFVMKADGKCRVFSEVENPSLKTKLEARQVTFPSFPVVGNL